ncbi:hypothetical protein FOA52_013656 [Chlamydomonas sp. UWO 241]|nr:hypothetical protein FOA52_013656 [Chlamydomonas sp. UWO 241]
MSFSLALRTQARLKMIDDGGVEEFEAPSACDMSHLELLDPSRAPAAAAAAAAGGGSDGEDEGEDAPDSMEAYERFITARGELDVIIDLIRNLEDAKYLDFRILSSKPRAANALTELATQSLARLGNRRAVLRDAAQRMREGAKALRASAARDNAYYSQAARLQAFWKLRVNMASAATADAPLSVDISLTEGAASSGLGISPPIPLVKDLTGSVCMRVPASGFREGGPGAAADTVGRPATGKLAVGTAAVHRWLLSQQSALMWRCVARVLDDEAVGGQLMGGGAPNFSGALSSALLSCMGRSSPGPFVRSLRPLALEHVSTCRLPSQTITEPPRPGVPAPSSLPLLPELSAIVGHAYFRAKLGAALDEQAAAPSARCVRLEWLPTTRACTSAIAAHLGSNHTLVLLVQDSAVEVCGIAAPGGTTSGWAREGVASVTKTEMPGLLASLLQQAGGLSWETTGERLRSYFENFGVVREAFVSYNRTNGRPRGFGFVVFESPEVADKVVAARHTIDRREVEAKKAVPKEEGAGDAGVAGGGAGGGLGAGAGGGGATAGLAGAPAGSMPATQPAGRKVFIGGLAPAVDDAMMREYFERYGEVVDAVVMYDHDNKRPRGFGFVTYATEESVEALFAAGAMQSIAGKQIEIKCAVPRDQMPAGPPLHHRGNFIDPRFGGGGRGGGVMGGGYGGGGYGMGPGGGMGMGAAPMNQRGMYAALGQHPMGASGMAGHYGGGMGGVGGMGMHVVPTAAMRAAAYGGGGARGGGGAPRGGGGGYGNTPMMAPSGGYGGGGGSGSYGGGSRGGGGGPVEADVGTGVGGYSAATGSFGAAPGGPSVGAGAVGGAGGGLGGYGSGGFGGGGGGYDSAALAGAYETLASLQAHAHAQLTGRGGSGGLDSGSFGVRGLSAGTELEGSSLQAALALAGGFHSGSGSFRAAPGSGSEGLQSDSSAAQAFTSSGSGEYGVTAPKLAPGPSRFTHAHSHGHSGSGSGGADAFGGVPAPGWSTDL